MPDFPIAVVTLYASMLAILKNQIDDIYLTDGDLGFLGTGLSNLGLEDDNGALFFQPMSMDKNHEISTKAYSGGSEHLYIRMSRLLDHPQFNQFNQENMDLTLRLFLSSPVGKTMVHLNTDTLPRRGDACTDVVGR
ncbi:predicted protein [Histoplasma capsulatum H143]|uniref:Uncharacterized protein n=1 Tax=Ajellomyces capsulatus (strain H143) TaxID=544712 RepID=C6HPC3_AJECH|nr:predicted protein [Histoplasma capsulatum H143]